MRSPLVAALLMLPCLAAPAGAVPIVGYVRGEITLGYYDPNPGGLDPFRFAPGSTAYISYAFDHGLSRDTGGGRYELRGSGFNYITSEGHSGTVTGGTDVDTVQVRDGAVDTVGFTLGASAGTLILIFSDPTGQAINSTNLPTISDLSRFSTVTIKFMRELGRGSDGFDATGIPVASAAAFPVPEPSGLVMGLVGMGLAGLGWSRCRDVK